MVAGSWASTTFGEPRSTQDIDVVIDPSEASLETLLRSMRRDGFYVDAEAATAAMRQRGMFNAIHLATGWKAGLIIRKARPFSTVEMARRRPAVIRGVPVMVASPEDTVISRLEWSTMAGGSQRQRRDVAGILRVQTGLDRGYIQHWEEALGLEAEWREAKAALAGG